MPDVVRTWKEGGYGTTVWFHELSCGHIFTDRRRSTKTELHCAVCDQLAALPPESTTIPLLDDLPSVADGDIVPDETARMLEGEAFLRLRLASALGVPVECVSVVESTTGTPGGAVVTLFPEHIAALLKRI